jgi:transcriptional regulator with XRE-family HTH domain
MSNHNRERKRINRAIGQRIKAEREAVKGMSQVALSALIAITQQQLARYETGRSMISAAMLCQIAAVLKRSMDHFAGGDGEPARRAPMARMVAELDTLDSEVQDSISNGVFNSVQAWKKTTGKVIGAGLMVSALLVHPMLDPMNDCAACQIAIMRGEEPCDCDA